MLSRGRGWQEIRIWCVVLGSEEKVGKEEWDFVNVDKVFELNVWWDREPVEVWLQ